MIRILITGLFVAIGICGCGEDDETHNVDLNNTNNANNTNNLNNANNANNTNNTNNQPPIGRTVDVTALLERQVNPQVGFPCLAQGFGAEDVLTTQHAYGYDGQGLVVVQDETGGPKEVRIVSEYAGVKLRERIWIDTANTTVDGLRTFTFDDQNRLKTWAHFSQDPEGDGTRLNAEPDETGLVTYTDANNWTTVISPLVGEPTTHAHTWVTEALALRTNETDRQVVFLEEPDALELSNFWIIQPFETTTKLSNITLDLDGDLAVDSTTTFVYDPESGVMTTDFTDDGSGTQIGRREYQYECGT